MACIPGVPIIVAKQSFVSQTASISTTTLYTPTDDGDYRIDLYLTMPTWWTGTSTVDLSWTDEYIAQSLSLPFGNPASARLNQSIPIHAVSGQPIQFDVTYAAHVSGSAYDLFITVVKE